VYGLAHRYHQGIPWPPTLDQAKQIYRRDYWAVVHGDEMPQPLALVLFDSAVIPGLGWAASALQTILRVEDDGVIGPDTLSAAKRSGWRTVHAMTAARIAEFERSARIRPVNLPYLPGWRNRALYAYREAVRLEV
jgi:lysozyme family protein